MKTKGLLLGLIIALSSVMCNAQIDMNIDQVLDFILDNDMSIVECEIDAFDNMVVYLGFHGGTVDILLNKDRNCYKVIYNYCLLDEVSYNKLIYGYDIDIMGIGKNNNGVEIIFSQYRNGTGSIFIFLSSKYAKTT